MGQSIKKKIFVLEVGSPSRNPTTFLFEKSLFSEIYIWIFKLGHIYTYIGFV